MMKERMKNADSKVCSKVGALSPVKIGFTLGVFASMPLLLVAIGGFGV